LVTINDISLTKPIIAGYSPSVKLFLKNPVILQYISLQHGGGVVNAAMKQPKASWRHSIIQNNFQPCKFLLLLSSFPSISIL
jgi:hypothetical protein